MLQGTTYWTDLFVRHFLFQNESTIDCDDLLFFVRKKHVKGSPRYLPKFEVFIQVKFFKRGRYICCRLKWTCFGKIVENCQSATPTSTGRKLCT